MEPTWSEDSQEQGEEVKLSWQEGDILRVGMRITFSVVPGCELDITINELEQRGEEIVITKAKVHKITPDSPMKRVTGLPPGWEVG